MAVLVTVTDPTTGTGTVRTCDELDRQLLYDALCEAWRRLTSLLEDCRRPHPTLPPCQPHVIAQYELEIARLETLVQVFR